MLSPLEEGNYRRLSHSFEPAILLMNRQVYTEAFSVIFATLAIQLCIYTECRLYETPQGIYLPTGQHLKQCRLTTMWNAYCGWSWQGCIYWDRGETVTFGPLYKTLVRVVSLLGTLAKLEELQIKYVVKIGGTKVCDDKVVEPLTKLKRSKKSQHPRRHGGRVHSIPCDSHEKA